MRKNRAGLQKNGMRMMVLDDDMNLTPALQAYFEANGYDVDTDNNPVQALERMRDSHYDILLLDFLMEPLCGDEVVSRLREFDRDIYIILLTGHMELAPPLNTLRELDIQGYYEKSDRFDQLALLVESCVKSIRQMNIIRDYRDGLARILEASPSLNRLLPVPEIMRLALEQVVLLTQSPGALLYFKEVANHPALYAGSGPYNMPLDQFEGSVQPTLREVTERAAQTRSVQQEKGFLVAPLADEKSGTFGWIVADALGVQNVDTKHLMGILAQQTASALRNAYLHESLQNAYEKLNQSYLETIEALRLVVDAKDIYTRGHSDRVSYYAVRLAKRVGMDDKAVERVRVSALFHDVGKMGVPDAVLGKRDRLDDNDMATIREHPLISEKIMSQLTLFGDLASIVCAHHERIDGKGYPRGLKGEEIPLEARVIALADSYDAMTSDRQYRPRMTFEMALDQIAKGRGTQFDEKLADAFIELIRAEHEEMETQLRWTFSGTRGEG